MQVKRVDSGSQDVLSEIGGTPNAADLLTEIVGHTAVDDPKGERALSDLAHLSDSDNSSGSNSATPSPPPSPSKRAQNPNPAVSQKSITKSNIGYHDDLLLLRSKLAPISQHHYESFWAETDNGPMWKAFHNQFRALELFNLLPGDFFEQKHSKEQSSADKLEAFRQGEIDDFNLFNNAYGLNNSINNNIHAVKSGYINFNQIIIAILNKLLETADLSKQYSEYYRWDALYRLVNELTSYNKTISINTDDQQALATPADSKNQSTELSTADAYQSLTDIYTVLENIKSPLTILRTHLGYQGIIRSVSSFYDNSHDQIFQYLYFSAHFKRAQILSIVKPLVNMNRSIKSPQNQSLRKYIEQLENGEITEALFITHLRKLASDHSWEQLNNVIQDINNIPNNQKVLADFLEIQIPENGISYANFLLQVENKSKAQSSLPVYKREVAKQVTLFAKGELTHIQFQGQLKILSLNYRPNSFWTRLWHYVGSIFTLNFSQLGEQWQQYGDIEHLNKVVRKNYKDTAAKRDSDIAILSVSNDVLPLTVKEIKNQDDSKVANILWLNEQEKVRCDAINREFSPIISPNEQNTNPHYATALSKLHFIASQKADFEKQTNVLKDQVTGTMKEHLQIKSEKSTTTKELPRSQQTRKSLVSAITLGLGLQRKAEVYSYVAETLAHEPKTLSVVG